MSRAFLENECEPDGEPFAMVRMFPIPYDLTVSGRPGARFGPAALFEASSQLESFDEELGWEALRHAGIAVEPELPAIASGPEEMMRSVFKAAGKLLKSGDFLFSVGGEHSLSAPLIEAHREKFGRGLCVVQFDAHADLRNSYQGSGFSHACAMRRVTDLGLSVFQVGIRSVSREDSEFLASKPGRKVRTWKASQLKNDARRRAMISSLLRELRGPVYITIDVDAFDPSVIPGTGTPEPGGLFWHEAVEILDAICLRKDVVGADLMELAPIPGLFYDAHAAARLAYRVISRVMFRRWKSRLR